MLLHEILKGWRVILGSGSPRRQELLKGLDIAFTIEYNHDFEEEIDPSLVPEKIPQALAIQKSYAFPRPLEPDELLITADTLVYCCGQILGKPDSRSKAIEMLQLLSGKRHTVYTALFFRTAKATHGFTDITQVTFAALSHKEIGYYVDHYEPYDKAGAYGIQEWIGYMGIEQIQGCYFNVMGLPLHSLYKHLKEFIAPLS